mgnify:CR=1 FL=1
MTSIAGRRCLGALVIVAVLGVGACSKPGLSEGSPQERLAKQALDQDLEVVEVFDDFGGTAYSFAVDADDVGSLVTAPDGFTNTVYPTDDPVLLDGARTVETYGGRFEDRDCSISTARVDDRSLYARRIPGSVRDGDEVLVYVTFTCGPA